MPKRMGDAANNSYVSPAAIVWLQAKTSKEMVTEIDVASAVISLQAFIRHQNQRRMSTSPIPAPIEKMNSHALEILCIFNAVNAASTIRIMVNIFPTNT